MSCPGDPSLDQPRRRSISAADDPPQRVSRNSNLQRDRPLAELFDERFQFSNVRAGGFRVRPIRNVCAFVETKIILLFPAVRLLAYIFDADCPNVPTVCWPAIIEIGILEFRLRSQMIAREGLGIRLQSTHRYRLPGFAVKACLRRLNWIAIVGGNWPQRLL